MTVTSERGKGAIRARMTVLATTDLHLNLFAWDDYSDRAAPGVGLESAWSTIAALRKRWPDSLLVDNGDALQGTALGDALAEAAKPGAPRLHPMIKAMNIIGYDALSLGNHDFNYGLDFLASALKGAKFPILCANLGRTDGGSLPARPFVLLDRMLPATDGKRHPVRVGLAGVLPPEVMVWESAHLSGRARVTSLVEAAEDAATRMRAAGAEIVIILCHAGIGRTAARAGHDADTAAMAVARLPLVDAVVAGHTHQVFPGPEFPAGPEIDPARGRLSGKPACMPGFGASHIGVLQLDLRRSPENRWHCTGGKGMAWPTGKAAEGTLQPSPSPFAALRISAERRTRSFLDQCAGTSAVPLNSLFSMVRDCPATRLVAQSMRWYAGRQLARTEWQGLPVLAAAAPMRAGGRGGPGNYTVLPPGPLRQRDLLSLCPFPNGLRLLCLTGAELSAWLEHSARTFRQVAQGAADVPLLDPARPPYDFDLIEGLRYEIDLSVDPNLGRIRDICHAGQPVMPQDRFVVATTDFRAAGGGSFPGCGTRAPVVLSDTILIRQIVARYLAETGTYAAPGEPVWRFTPQPQTSAVFETGPAAASCLPDGGLEPVGMTADGFQRLRVWL